MMFNLEILIRLKWRYLNRLKLTITRNAYILERVGHANMKTTLEIYKQVSNTTKEKLIQETDSWIF